MLIFDSILVEGRICIELFMSAAVTACGKCPDILLDALPQAAAKRYWGFGGKQFRDKVQKYSMQG